MNTKNKFTSFLVSLTLIFGSVLIAKNSQKFEEAFATYTNGDAATYYSSIDESKSGNALLTELRSLNLSKRQSTVGYSSMGTSPSGQFKYTDYDPDYVQYDSNGQPYGTRISSFYTYTSATSWNREHVWPNSHGGGSGGDAGSPYPDADIHMPRPTISSENSSRGNSFFVEGMNHSSNGWDPYTAGYSAESRGEAARITFYCMLVNSKLNLCASNTTPSGTDPITGTSYGSGHTMGNLETLLKWNINYPVTQREKNRNEGAEYLQGNRNAFIDHPEYACKIWGSFNSTTQSLCNNASWDTGPSVTLSKTSASIVVDNTITLTATSSDSSTITWSSSDETVASISTVTSSSGANVTITGIGPGTATITARATIESTVYSAICSVTVTSSGGSGGGDTPVDGTYSILYTDLATAYPTTPTSYTSANGLSFTAYNTANYSSKVQFKKNGGYIYSNDSLNLSSLTINNMSGTLTVHAGTSKNPSNVITGSNGVYDLSGYNYFKIINSSSSVASCASIDVAIEQSATEKTLSSISIETAPTKTTYTVGENFNPAGLVIRRTFSDSTQDTYTYSNHTSEFTFSPSISTALQTSHKSVTITYEGKSTTQSITVNEPVVSKTLSSISLSGQTTQFYVGDAFSFGGTVTALYSDNTEANVTASSTFSGYNLSTAGEQTVTASYTYEGVTKTAKYQITVVSTGGQSEIISESKRIVSKVDSQYFQTGSIYVTGNETTGTATCDAFDVTWLKNNGTSSVLYTYDELRVYGGHSFTITPKSGYTITSVVITANSGSYANAVGGSSLTNCNKSTNGSTVTLTPLDGTSALGFTNSAQSRLNYVVVNYEYESTSGTIDPEEATLTSITVDYSNVEDKFMVGDTFVHNGLVVTANYDNDTTADVTDLATYTGYDMNVSDAYTVTVSYTEGLVTETGVYFIAVYERGIEASIEKTYKPGETISKSDIEVVDSAGRAIESFNFADDNYMVRYEDTNSGGTYKYITLQNSISYQELTCNVIAITEREEYNAPETTTKTYTGANLKSAGVATSYTEDQVKTFDGTTFLINGYIYSNTYLSFNNGSKTSAPGSITNTTPYSTGISNVTINGASPDIQLSTNGTAWVDLSEAAVDSVNYLHFKVFYKNTSVSSWVNISSIVVTLKGQETAKNVANYIMFEDTNNQCETKLNIAIGYLQNMSSSEKDTFQNSSDYVIATARERLEAWATNQGKTINYSTGALQSSINGIGLNLSDDVFTTIVIVSSLLTGCAVSLIIYFKRKKRIIK